MRVEDRDISIREEKDDIDREHKGNKEEVKEGDNKDDVLVTDIPTAAHICNASKSQLWTTLVGTDIISQKDGLLLLYPTWIPAYPGSGSSMLQTLISSMLPGLSSDDVYDTNCTYSTTITCKTHYPVINIKNTSPKHVVKLNNKYAKKQRIHDGSQNYYHGKFNDNFFLLLRNPSRAIPSQENYYWEKENNAAGETHKVEMPQDAWRKVRDDNFISFMDRWIGLIKHWLDNSQENYTLSLLLPYEELLDPVQGPALMYDIANEILLAHNHSSLLLLDNNSNRNNVVMKKHENDDLNIITCIWNEAIMNHPSYKRKSTYIPGYTKQQKEYMLTSLQDLVIWIKGEEDERKRKTGGEGEKEAKRLYKRLNKILSIYHKTIQTDLVIDET